MTENQLHTALTDLADAAPHDPDLAGGIRRRAARRRLTVWAPAAAAAAVVVVVAGILIFRPAATPVTAAPSRCAPLVTRVLPSWARAGFSDPEPQMPFATSSGGTMVAIVFADPLVSPELPDRGNKILWVTSDNDSAGQALHINGHREGGTGTMTETVDGGPGPSYVDVPAPGCWVFDLTWGKHHETIALNYVPAASVTTS